MGRLGWASQGCFVRGARHYFAITMLSALPRFAEPQLSLAANA